MFEFFNEISEFINNGLYAWVVETYAWLVIKFTEFKLGFMLTALEFSWDVASSILSQLNITEQVESAMASLPADTVNYLNFFNIINGINILINAFVTRFVLSFTFLR